MCGWDVGTLKDRPVILEVTSYNKNLFFQRVSPESPKRNADYLNSL